jgi:Leukotriene A4 hydrolase, C-terminal
MGEELAVETFLQHKDSYHPICAKMVASDLSVSVGGSNKLTSILSSTYFKISVGIAAAAVVAGIIMSRRKK